MFNKNLTYNSLHISFLSYCLRLYERDLLAKLIRDYVYIYIYMINWSYRNDRVIYIEHGDSRIAYSYEKHCIIERNEIRCKPHNLISINMQLIT